MVERNYSITLEIKGELEKDKSPIAGDNNENSSTNLKGEGFLKGDTAKAFGKAVTAYHYAKSFTDQIVSHEVSLVELKTGSRHLQERANFTLNVGQKVVGAVESIGVGAAVGGWMGALAGLFTSSINMAISYNQSVDTLNLQRSLENIGLQQTFIRAGANGSRRQ